MLSEKYGTIAWKARVQWRRRIVVEVDRMLVVHGRILMFVRCDDGWYFLAMIVPNLVSCSSARGTVLSGGRLVRRSIASSNSRSRATSAPTFRRQIRGHKLTDMDRWAASRLGWVHEE